APRSPDDLPRSSGRTRGRDSYPARGGVMPERVSELARILENAERAVRDLSEKVSINETAVRRAKFAAIAALCGIGFHLMLVILIGWGLYAVDTNQGRIEDLQHSQQVQTDRT